MGAVRGTTPDYILTLTGDRLTIATDDSGSTVAFSLSQADTLSFIQGTVEVQLKCINAQGKVDGSGTGQLTIDRALLEKVITYANDTN